MSTFVKIGALWLRDGARGKFMSGEIEINGVKTNILVFKNNYKDDAKKPDYVIQRPVDDPPPADPTPDFP